MIPSVKMGVGETNIGLLKLFNFHVLMFAFLNTSCIICWVDMSDMFLCSEAPCSNTGFRPSINNAIKANLTFVLNCITIKTKNDALYYPCKTWQWNYTLRQSLQSVLNCVFQPPDVRRGHAPPLEGFYYFEKRIYFDSWCLKTFSSCQIRSCQFIPRGFLTLQWQPHIFSYFIEVILKLIHFYSH